MAFRLKWCIALFVLFALSSGPCWAWLYDGGTIQRLAATIGQGMQQDAIAAPFILDNDSYATSFGGALGRAFGPVGAKVNVSLTTWSTHPETVIATWGIVPANAVVLYYYVQPEAPILLRGGVPYSLVFTPEPNFAAAISYSLQGFYGFGTSDSGQTWGRLQLPVCARVDGYVVPEPSSASCLLLCFAGLPATAALRRRRNG